MNVFNDKLEPQTYSGDQTVLRVKSIEFFKFLRAQEVLNFSIYKYNRFIRHDECNKNDFVTMLHHVHVFQASQTWTMLYER